MTPPGVAFNLCSLSVQYRQPAEQHVWVASPAVVPPPADSVNKPRTVRKFFFINLEIFSPRANVK